MAQARPARRVVRTVDALTVLKFSGLFYLSLYTVVLVAAVILWSVASFAGVVDDLEDFAKELFGWKEFGLKPGQILVGSAIGGAVVVLIGTGMNVLAAVLYNLISDVVGGVEVTVIEDDRHR